MITRHHIASVLHAAANLLEPPAPEPQTIGSAVVHLHVSDKQIAQSVLRYQLKLATRR